MGELPGGLITKPTLVWKLNAMTGGTRRSRPATRPGVDLAADYNLTLNGDDTEGSIGAMVALLNISGSGYSNARLAGGWRRPADQSLADEPRSRHDDGGGGCIRRPTSRLQEESFFQYHLYTLPRRTDIKSNGTHRHAVPGQRPGQEGLCTDRECLAHPGAANRSPIEYGAGSRNDVEVFIEFENDRDNGWAFRCRPGRCGSSRPIRTTEPRVPRRGPHRTHASNETIRIKTGDAFDVIGERTQVDFKLDKSRRMMSDGRSRSATRSRSLSR